MAALRERRLEFFQAQAGIPPAYRHARLTDFSGASFAISYRTGFRLFGKPRTGKTHFLCALGNSMVLNGFPVWFVTVPDLLEELRLAAQRGRGSTPEPRGIKDFCSVPYLLLDDLGTARETEFAAEVLFTIFNHRFNHRLHLSVSSNVDPKTMDSRLLGRILEMTTEVIL